ncbi:MAG TPA: Asp-tRNA(Asn)/Glu-tRNA(Gln) amidotransferase subunit GatB [Clostridiales bacterium]|nr:Asp-tRNA(Asn)/Glu-tRNA(Gln) amidotransferase subunit GatB [Clostridiales bacterium]
MIYLAVIGLEVHTELKTNTKIFCSCKNEFNLEPNINCCPVCVGMPGALPALNKKAVEYAIKAGLALNCEINTLTRWERKNYFYPDLPKAYQVSQAEAPVCLGGYMEIETQNGPKKIRINHIHLEEDAGKLIHSEYGGSLVDYNRGGVPLIEIVTEPDLSSADETLVFLENLRALLKYIGVSDCRMEQGSLRCDVNVSLRKEGEPLGIRTEMKNLASFKAVHRAITYEINRQTEILNSGGEIIQETRRWDDQKGRSYSMRAKEDAQDYRYFPETDLPPVKISSEFVRQVKETLPLLPKERAQKYVEEYNLPQYDAQILTSEITIADFFDECVALFDNPKMISNWIMTDVMRKIKEHQTEDIVLPINAKNFTKMLKLHQDNVINQPAAKTLFEHMWHQDSKTDPEQLIQKLNLVQISDEGELENILKEIIQNNPAAADDVRGGNKKAIAFFVGQVMKATKGKANPKTVNELIQKLL